MVTDEHKRELRVLRAILETATEAAQDGEVLKWPEFVSRACEYGTRANITSREVGDLLVKSLQCIVLVDKEEWA